jgi:cysteine protease ATG4
MSWFLDAPSAPFSIHNIAIAGTMLDKQIGQWHGPNTVAQVLQ